MFKLSAVISLASIFLSVALFGLAQRSPLESATIEGQVVSADSGKPIIGASVIRPGSTSVGLDGIVAVKPAVTSTTDKDGRFQLSGMDPGFIPITVFANGFETTFLSYTVSATQQFKDATFRLTAAGVIFGRVLDSQGQPLPRAYVWTVHPTEFARKLHIGKSDLSA